MKKIFLPRGCPGGLFYGEASVMVSEVISQLLQLQRLVWQRGTPSRNENPVVRDGYNVGEYNE